MRMPYLQAKEKLWKKESGLAERFYVACKIRGNEEEVEIFKNLEKDAEKIYGDTNPEKSKNGVRVNTIVVEYKRVVDDKPAYANVTNFIVMSIEPI